ncbi:MAG: methionine--tRNA ligase [Acidobacteria bacterium]|nr:methionine--tRNA ligase [Acidobacteriota bacterium]
MPPDSFYITTPIYYVNDNPHLGHIYTTVVADAIARFKRACGYDVYFLTGTDEHGQKIEKSAAKQGITPLELADLVVSVYHDLWKKMEISHTRFIRTTDQVHQKGVTRLFEIIRDRGDIYAGDYEGWYCTSCEKYISEKEAVERRCPDCGKETELLKEPCHFFRLSKYQQPLLDHYRTHPEFVQPPSRLNEVMAFVEGGLRDLSISRSSIRWGVPVPAVPSEVMYVWFDALSNYITGAGYGSDDEAFARRWPAAIHLIGKDILRFHAVYWPAYLMAAGIPLPRTVFAHGWWLQDNRKMSKSLGNVFNPAPLIERYGPDALRYFLLRDVTLGLDSNFSEEAVRNRYNFDLANDLGNLNSRVQKLLDRTGEVTPEEALPAGPDEEAVRASYYKCRNTYVDAFNEYAPSRALAAAWEFITTLNGYIAAREPWTMLGDPARRPRLLRVLQTCTEGLRVVGLMVAPAMPDAAARIAATLGAPPGDPWEFDHNRRFRLSPSNAALFPRIIEKEKPVEETKIEETQKEAANLISIGDFQKVQLRVAQVKTAERVEGAKKLLKLIVDIGTETRQIVAGIAEAYEPEALVGKKIIVVANLKPAVLRGVESQGMLLAASIGGLPVIATFEGDPPAGTAVK